jgi:hypothetical protein
MAKNTRNQSTPLFDDLPREENGRTINHPGTDTSSTFQDNLRLPIHGWFRYSAGFSAAWVNELLLREKSLGRRHVLDPFAGSGTTVLEAEACGFEGIGIEPHPFVSRVAKAKLCWRTDPGKFTKLALAVLAEAPHGPPLTDDIPKLIQKCFPPQSISRLYGLRHALLARKEDAPPWQLTWLVLASILRECSPVGTAQWQYILPNKTKVRTVDPFVAFEATVYAFARDMKRRQQNALEPQGAIYQEDARELPSVPRRWADLVVTSPPYANNYDYADATRLEMTFFGEIDSWGCLQQTVRQHLIRSCTQHVSALVKQTADIIADPVLTPIAGELGPVCEELGKVRESHGGKKNYHTMIAAYFKDMATVWHALRRATADHARVCFVIGDSAPYGVYVPVDKWMGQLAVAAGFQSYRFEKTRERNVKWKNRKHRVPLHEGRLWIEG